MLGESISSGTTLIILLRCWPKMCLIGVDGKALASILYDRCINIFTGQSYVLEKENDHFEYEMGLSNMSKIFISVFCVYRMPIWGS